MAQFIPCLNTAKFALTFTDVNGDQQINTIWVKRSAPWTLSTLNAVSAGLVTWFTTAVGGQTMQANMSNQVSFVQVQFRDYTTQNGLSGIYQTGLPLVGTIAQPQLAAGLTFAFTLRTGLAGRSYRGRVFQVGMTLSAIVNIQNNTVVPAFAAGIAAVWANLITAIPAADPAASWVVTSRYYQPGGSGTPTVPRTQGVMTPVASVGYHNTLLDFQRRRAPAHARHH